MLTEEEKNNLRALLERMYQLNGDDTFSGLVLEMWKFLGIKEECNVMAFENALVDTISDYTAIKKSDTKNTERSKAKKRDLLLLMFGLLDGKSYYHTQQSVNGGIVSVTAEERIFCYIKQSDYKKLRSKREKSDDKSCRDAVYRAQRREVTDENRFFDYFINRVNGGINDKTFQKYVQKYIDSPPETIELPDGRKCIVLPQPSYTLRNPLFSAEQEESGKTEEQAKKEAKVSDEGHEDKPIKLNPPEPPVPEPDIPPDIPPKPPKTTVWLKVSVAVLAASVFALAIIGIGSVVISQKAILAALKDPKVNQKPYRITFTNPEEWLPFGISKNLTVKPEPADAALDGLRCKSEGDNAHIIEILSEPGLHIKAIDESEDSEKCDIEVKAYMDYNETISDVVTIHVIKDGQNESMGEGKLDDKSSGSSSQRAD